MPPVDSGLAAREDVAAAIQAVKALLAAPVFEKQIPLALLTKMATDEKVPARERGRAIVVLGQLQLEVVRLLADLTGVKEQRLRDLGIAAPPQEVNLTQVHTRIEIVREGARDWRTVEGG